jgi:hypothetical protein
MNMENFPRVPSKKTPEQEQQENEKRKEYRSEYLKGLGIELLSREELAKMSFNEVQSYQVEMKNKIFKVMNSLPLKEQTEKEVIFNEALGLVDIVHNPSDHTRLKNEFESK